MKRYLKWTAVALVIALAFNYSALPAEAGVPADTFYVDSISGSDFNSGTSEGEAWATLQKAAARVYAPGERLLLRSGDVFVGGITLQGCGTPQAPILLASYGEGPKPLITSSAAVDLIRMFDISYWTLDGIELTAPGGGGIWIDTLTAQSDGITLRNLTFHDMQNYTAASRDNLSAGAAGARAGIMVKGLPARSRFAVNGLTVSGCEFFDCGNGISLWGSWNDEQNPWCELESDIDPVYNEGILVEDCSFTGLDAEAVVVGICDGAVVRNCSAINCCQGGAEKRTFCTAAMWFWGSENSVFENCEIAGQKNFGDGMAVDFDSRSNHCTYQYIYSHDNTKFMTNCPTYSGQHGNTVRYCLSVNDNRGVNKGGGNSGERGLKFYNNTIVNAQSFNLGEIKDAVIVNNIFVLMSGHTVNCSGGYEMIGNNCYYNCPKPLRDIGSMCADPQFAGKDETEKNSFVLKSCSPCIDAGAQAEQDMGGRDLYGNAAGKTHNIGCYEGDGAAGDFDPETPGEVLGAMANFIRGWSAIELVRIFRWLLEQFDRFWA